MTYENFLETEFKQHRDLLSKTFNGTNKSFSQLCTLAIKAIRSDKKIIVFGNGGSAADAQHLAAELVVRYKENRNPIAAIALSTDSSILTACGNDKGFNLIFDIQVNAIGQAGDLAIGISTSGKSENVIYGLRTAQSKGISTASLTGNSGGEVKSYSNICLSVPSNNVARIQEMHSIIIHAFCDVLERDLIET